MLAVSVVVSESSPCSRRLNINRETTTDAKLAIVSASFQGFRASMMCLHICCRCWTAPCYILGGVRIRARSLKPGNDSQIRASQESATRPHSRARDAYQEHDDVGQCRKANNSVQPLSILKQSCEGVGCTRSKQHLDRELRNHPKSHDEILLPSRISTRASA